MRSDTKLPQPFFDKTGIKFPDMLPKLMNVLFIVWHVEDGHHLNEFYKL